MDASLTFQGAAQNVTGARYLLEAGGVRLLVDCGMHQERSLKERDWTSFPFDPASLDAVLLTHAHLDHCGLLPRLVKGGFKGPIHCTAASAEIARIVIADSARLQEEDVAFKKRRHEATGLVSPHPYEPLYTVRDAEAVTPLFNPARYDRPVDLGRGVSCTFREAGHILGSSWISVDYGEASRRRTVVFSGDVGRPHTPILRDPRPVDRADYLLIESTYGDRDHKPSEQIPEALARIINETARAGGNVVVPSFATERSQELLYHMSGLLRQGRIPRIRVFLDSPMAIKVTEVFRHHPEMFDEETTRLIEGGQHPCDFPSLTVCRTVEESKAIQRWKAPAVIIAGAGMCTGGRIKHHLKANVGRPESTILFVGYQASGTLGRVLLEGAPEVRIHGETHRVAARVTKVNGFSAHADRRELLGWLSAMSAAPRNLFVVHGEPTAAQSFAATVRAEKGWSATVPAWGERVEIE